MAIKIFVDFDGTITIGDVGDSLFRHFGGAPADEAIDAYHAEKISARECFLRKAAACGCVSKDAVDRFLDEQQIDPGFKGFAEFCYDHRLTLCILSDGMDYYIDRILAREGIREIDRFSNILTMVPANENGAVRLNIDFPAENPDCDRCACCKRNIMLSRSGEADFLVYVGEGYSDRCPAAYADVVFAKDALQTYCQRDNISYLPYTTFEDVRTGVANLLKRKHLRPRRSASLRRAAAFLAE